MRRSAAAIARQDIGHQAEGDTQHPDVLGQHQAFRGRAEAAILPHTGRAEIQPDKSCREGGQAAGGERRRNDGKQQSDAESDLRGGQELDEQWSGNLSQERIGSGGRAMQPGSRVIVGVALAEPGIEDEGASDDATTRQRRRPRPARYSATTSSVSSSSDVSAARLSKVISPCCSRFTRSHTSRTCA
jgi:hypothetical protein